MGILVARNRSLARRATLFGLVTTFLFGSLVSQAQGLIPGHISTSVTCQPGPIDLGDVPVSSNLSLPAIDVPLDSCSHFDPDTSVSFNVKLAEDSPTGLFAGATEITTAGIEIPDPDNFKLIATQATTVDHPFKLVITATGHPSNEQSSVAATANGVSTPICKQINTVTAKNTTAVNTSVTVNLDYNPVTDSGCISNGGGKLTYTVQLDNTTSASMVTHGTVVEPAGLDYTISQRTFIPELDYIPPQDYDPILDVAKLVTFRMLATDSIGQTASILVFVNISEPVQTTCPSLQSQVIFNNPTKSGKKFLITNAINGYIDCATEGSVITMSWFSLTDKDVVFHLQQAKERGVNIRFLINSHATKPASTSYPTWNLLKTFIPVEATADVRNSSVYKAGDAGSWALYCDSGCLTPPPPPGVTFPADSEAEFPALHAKFFAIAFPEDPITHTYLSIGGISSSNPTRAQAVQAWNNAQFVVERGTSLEQNTLFHSLDDYFKDLSAQGLPAIEGGNPPQAVGYRNLARIGNTSFVAFPHIGTGGVTDDITTTLKDVKCTYFNSRGQFKRTQIYINMFVFTRTSPAMALWHMANNPRSKNGGCQIHILYTDMSSAIKWNGNYLKNTVGTVPWGVADCLSAPSVNINGHYAGVSGPQRRKMKNPDGSFVRDEKGHYRYQTVQVCNKSGLYGTLPTINQGLGHYCWLWSSSPISGGSINACVTTPLKLTKYDPADDRAKLEPYPDSKNHMWYSHQKYMLISGMVNGRFQYLTFAGTPNLTVPGLRYNDEILAVTTGSTTYNAYLNNFKAMKSWLAARPYALYNICRSVGNC